jgi:hypothetical protein
MDGDMVSRGSNVGSGSSVRAHSAGHPWPTGDPLTQRSSNPEALPRWRRVDHDGAGLPSNTRIGTPTEGR